MYWVSCRRKDGTFGVTDTMDNVETYFTADELLHMVRNGECVIDGVLPKENCVCVVKLAKDTVNLLKRKDIHAALSTMSTSGVQFVLKLAVGRGAQDYRTEVTIGRYGVNSYRYKSYDKPVNLNLSIDDMIMQFDMLASVGWKVEDCRVKVRK